MCGVAGFFAYGGNAAAVNRDELCAVRDHMAARGPDGTGEWFSADGRVALGHRRLAIIDLSERGAQPMASADGRIVISFNGEIYNHRELRHELERAGRVFRSDSDTEVLLYLYEQHGTAMLSMLRGMYAIALWDGRDRTMLLARDAFGIKPLYYADDGSTVRAASQVKALLLAKVDTRPEPAGHAGFFLWGSVPAPWTLYRGIRALPAGHFIRVDERGVHEPRAFCVISDLIAQAVAQPAMGSRDEALEVIGSALRSTIAAHLVADVPVGLFLSGGLDSALIAALVREHGTAPRSLTLQFAEYAGTPNDEAPHAQMVAQAWGTHHNTVSVGHKDFAEQCAELLAAMDQPSIDGVNTWFVTRAAASLGIKVALSGLGGDELFASYPSFSQVPQLASWMRVPSRIPGLGVLARKLGDPIARRLASPKYAGLIEYGGTTAGAYLLRRALHMPWELPHVMDPDMARAGWESLQTMQHLASTTRAAGHGRLAVSALEMSWYMRHQLLVDADWAGMAHSVEIRVPFVDVDLLRQVVPWFARHPGITKQEVVRAAVPQLATALLERPKVGFNVPVAQWLDDKSTRETGLRGWATRVHDAQGAAAKSAVSPRPSARGLKVLLLATDAYGGHGGIAFYNRCLAQALAQMDEVSEVVVAPRVMRFAAPQIPPKIRFPRHAHSSKLRYLFTLVPLLFERFDIVICGHLNLLAAAGPIAKLKGAALVTQVHGIEAWRVGRPAARMWLPHVDAVWSVSQITAERMNRWAGLPPEKYRIIPNTFHAGQFGVAPRDPELVRRYGLEGRKVVMTLARLAGFERYKGIDEILEAVPALRAAEPSLAYMIVGDGDDQARLEAKARALGLSRHVIFTGFVDEERKADYLRLADVFALPGRGEGFGIVFLEALACGVPVVGSLIDGSREALLDGELGELANPDSIPSVVECVLKALRKPHGVPDRLAEFGWLPFQAKVGENVRRLLARGHGRHLPSETASRA